MTFSIYPIRDRETGGLIDTNTAAHHIGFSPKTLRIWASTGSGPLLPRTKIKGKHRYAVADLLMILQGVQDVA